MSDIAYCKEGSLMPFAGPESGWYILYGDEEIEKFSFREGDEENKKNARQYAEDKIVRYQKEALWRKLQNRSSF